MATGFAPDYGQLPWLTAYTSPPTLVSTETRTDAVGSYTAYVYSDGHIETDPAGRPTYKEDLQRQLASQLAKSNAGQYLQAASTAGVSQPTRVSFDLQASSGLRAVAPAYCEFLSAASDFASTVGTSPARRAEVLGTVDLGGELTGSNAGQRPEYGV